MAVVAEGAQLVSAVSFSYVDRISGEVVQAYQTERDYWQHQRIGTRKRQRKRKRPSKRGLARKRFLGRRR